LPTGGHFHRYVNPERDSDPEAERVHGLSRAFLSDKPLFADPTVVGELLAFIGDAPLIAHNAAFDRAFVDHELDRAGLPPMASARWIDSLAIAQQRYPGMYNSLDALCKRFRISLAEREKHGALVDARLLASVYLELRGGREARLDLDQARAGGVVGPIIEARHGPRPRPMAPRLTEDERLAHQAFVAQDLPEGALWRSARPSL
jgi:DNA polymerase-3 subunit epsilon